jgi:hypothetical protein
LILGKFDNDWQDEKAGLKRLGKRTAQLVEITTGK